MERKNFHGSDLEEIEKAYGIPKEEIVSFSSNVNPLGVSQKFLSHILAHPESVSAYPDRGYEALRTAIGEYSKADPSHIFVGSGATELISKTIEAAAPKQVLMISPTYSEYTRKLLGENAVIDSYELKWEEDFAFNLSDFVSKIPGHDLIMICNPNNPTGTALDTETIGSICRGAEKSGCRVLVDETYVEFCAGNTSVSAVEITKEYGNLSVLRGTSKFFSTPGLRLGYMVCSDPDFMAKTQAKTDPWSVNSVAAVSGPAMFSDEDFIKKTKSFVKTEMDRMCNELKKLPLHVYEPSANFVLLRIEKDGISAYDIFEHCIKQGLMIRDCSSFPGLGDRHIRLCLSTMDNNNRLLKALGGIL